MKKKRQQYAPGYRSPGQRFGSAVLWAVVAAMLALVIYLFWSLK